MHLLSATSGAAIVGYLLHESGAGPFGPHLHFVARDPAMRGLRIGDALWNEMLRREPGRPIGAWPETEEGRVAMVRWGFTGSGTDWEYP